MFHPLDSNSYGPVLDLVGSQTPSITNLRSAQVRVGELCRDEPKEDEAYDGEDERVPCGLRDTRVPRALRDCGGQRCRVQGHGCSVLKQYRGRGYKITQAMW